MCTSWHTDRYLIRSVFSIVYRWFKYLSPDPLVVILRIASSRMVGVRGIYMSLW